MCLSVMIKEKSKKKKKFHSESFYLKAIDWNPT